MNPSRPHPHNGFGKCTIPRLFANHRAVAVLANAVPDACGSWGGCSAAVWVTQVTILSPVNQVLAWGASLLRLNECGHSDDGENQLGEKHYSLHEQVLGSRVTRVVVIPSHLQQAGVAISPINRTDDCPHDRTLPFHQQRRSCLANRSG